MKFRIDIQDEKVDLSKFQKACRVYMGQMERLEFDVYLKDYLIEINIGQVEGHNQRLVEFHFSDLRRNDDGTVKGYTSIVPMSDSRFQEIRIFQELYGEHKGHKVSFEASDAAKAAAKLEMLIRTIFKVNNLKVFL